MTLHIFTEDMQQGEVAAMLEDGDDVVILVGAHLTAQEEFDAVQLLLTYRWGPLSLAV